MRGKIRQRLPILAVAALAVGAYTFGPAIAANFLTEKAAKKTFVTKKAAKSQYLKKKAANGTFAKIGDAYTKAEADNAFAEEGDSYTKAESDANFAPAAEQVTFSVPPSQWNEDPGFDFMRRPTAVQTTFEKTGAASGDAVFYADVPLDLSGPATLVNARVCFGIGSDVTSVDAIQVQQTKPTNASPVQAPVVVANETPAQAGCRTLAPGAAVTVDPTDVLGLAVQADFADTGSEAQIRFTSATVTLQT